MNCRRRLSWCAALCLLPLAPIAARLCFLQVFATRRMSAMAKSEATREQIKLIQRGRILDRSGKVLAQSLPSWSAFLDPSMMRQSKRHAPAIAKALNLNPAEVARKASGRSKFVWLKRKLDLAEVDALQSLKVEGVGVVPDEQRYYPNGDMARPLLGLVGLDGAGMAGVELQQNKELSGIARKVPLLRDGAGRRMELAPHAEDAPVPDLILTIDRTIQHFAEAALLDAVQKHRPEKATIVVQDPRTGDLLALASFPSDPLKLPAVQDAYEPGSTFKVVTVAAALEEKLARVDDVIDAENGRWEVSPKIFIKDHEPDGLLALSQVIERSSNIGTAKVGLRLTPEKFNKWARAFGFGARTVLAFPGETAGKLKETGKSSRVVLANNAFGQGLSVSSLQLTAAYSALANGGKLLEPRLRVRQGSSPVVVRQVMSEQTLRSLNAILEGVVERGTGQPARVPGYRIAGKTGTAQKIDPATGKYSKEKYVGSFVGFAPASDPRWTILVTMDSPRVGYYGTDVAAPVFAKLLRNLLGVYGVKPDQQAPPPDGALARQAAEADPRTAARP
ncbi:MAG: hypothetical protein HY078_12815 [Elusimicrobia bacterium]|nr:hypothetical protein [Elusimicrobiota bacterium]